MWVRTILSLAFSLVIPHAYAEDPGNVNGVQATFFKEPSGQRYTAIPIPQPDATVPAQVDTVFPTPISATVSAPIATAVSTPMDVAFPTPISSHASSAFWYLNAEVAALSAIRGSASQTFLLDDFVAPATETPLRSTPSNDQLTASPRITFGKVYCSGWGLQTSYWDFNSTSGSAYAVPLFAPTMLPDLNIASAQNQTRAYTLDIEATRRFYFRDAVMIGTLCARYGALKNASSAVAFGQSVLDDQYALSSISDSSFYGTGLTYSLLRIKPLQNRCFSLYSGVRLSHLFGQNTAMAQTSATMINPSAGAQSTNGGLSHDSASLFIAQLQAGVLWTRDLRRYDGRLFARAGFEYQYWNADDVTATATSFAGSVGSSQAIVTADAGDLNTHFVGFTLAAGYAW